MSGASVYRDGGADQGAGPRTLAGLRVTFIAGTLASGGAERQLYYQLQACCSLGVLPQVLCLTRGERWESAIRGLGVPVHWVGSHPSRARRCLRIASEVRRHRSAIVQSAHPYTNLYAVAAARLTGARDIGAVRNDGVFDANSLGVLRRPSLRYPRVLAGNSYAGLESACAIGGRADRGFYLPNAVDTDLFRHMTRSRGDAFTILGVGRQVPSKRFDRFLRVVAGVRARCGERVLALLVGSGPAHGELQRYAASLGLGAGVVSFLPETQDVASVYQRGDVLLLTSDHEGTPNVILEAMAAGLPVVATQVGGVGELVVHQVTGYVCGAVDEHGMIAAVEQLACDISTASRMGHAGRAKVESLHSVSHLQHGVASLLAAACAYLDPVPNVDSDRSVPAAPTLRGVGHGESPLNL